jgi:hypothetical protein
MSNQTSAAATADLIVGARAIANELLELGLLIDGSDANLEDRVYYIARKGKLPIGRFGKSLIASRTKLRNAVHALAS